MVTALLPYIDRFLGRLLPGDCLLCQQSSDGQRLLCSWCKSALPETGPCCPQCGLPSGSEWHTWQTCGECLRQPPPWDTLIALGDYIEPWRKLITDLKFHGQWPNAYLLASLLTERVAALELDWPDVLLPVPLATRRQARRGYNQAGLLAKTLGRQLGIAVDQRSLMRARYTPPQSGLNKAARLHNLQQAFALTRQAKQPGSALSRYQHVGLVDDVVTSGATVGAVCELLRQAGVRQITVLCICRTSLEDEET